MQYAQICVGRVERKRYGSVILLLGSFERRNENTLDFKAVVDQGISFRFGDVFRQHQQPKPIFGFGGFLQWYLQLRNKVSLTDTINGFVGVCSDGCAASDDLLWNDGLMLCFRKIAVNFYDSCTKINRFFQSRYFLSKNQPILNHPILWDGSRDYQIIIQFSVFSFQYSFRKFCRCHWKLKT